MQEITRLIEVTLVLMKDGRKLAELYEPESGDFTRVELDDLNSFSKNIGAELNDWFDFMEEEQKEQEA